MVSSNTQSMQTSTTAQGWFLFLNFSDQLVSFFINSKQAVQDVQREGKICIFDVEIDGVKNLKKTGLRARYVFVSPPNMETLEERLRRRGTETEESLRNRLNRASEEIRFSQVEGMFDLIIENNCVDQAYQALESLLMPVSCVLWILFAFSWFLCFFAGNRVVEVDPGQCRQWSLSTLQLKVLFSWFFKL